MSGRKIAKFPHCGTCKGTFFVKSHTNFLSGIDFPGIVFLKSLTLEFFLFTQGKFSNFPATLILREINFGWFQKVKNYHFVGFDFWKMFTLENVKNCNKIQIYYNRQNGSFWGYKMTKKWFHVKSKWQKNLENSTLLFCPKLSVFTFQN